MDSMRPVLAALAAMVVLGLSVFAVVSLFGGQAEAPPVPQLTPAGAFSLANLPPPAVPAPVQTRPEAVDQPLPAGPAAASPSPDALGSGDAGRRIEDSGNDEVTGSKPDGDRDSRGDDRHSDEQNRAQQNTADQNRADQNRADQNTADQNTADQNTADQNTADQNTADQNRAEQNGADQNRADQNGAEHHDAGQDRPGAWPETPAERNERLRREIAFKVCDKYHVPRERCPVNR
jgi:type IV secretory pathway VirB10-like protein